MANTNGMAGEEIGNVYTRMANKVEQFADQSANFYNIIAALKNGTQMNGGLLTLDRIQLMENHEIRILPAEPIEVTDIPPLSDLPQPNGEKPVEVSYGNN